MSTIVATARPKRRLKPLLRTLFWALLGLVLLPYGLVLIYLAVPPVSTLMVWRFVTGAKVERTWVPIGETGPLPLAVVTSEDARFCTHRGIDWQEIREAIDDAGDGEPMRGGSTITQQVAKNLFLWQGRSWVRKAFEAPLALWIDLVMPKRRVLEIYLNIAEWGPDGQFGAKAGAARAFGKEPRALTQREAALMAAILPNPKRRSAGRPGPGVSRLAGIYQARMRANPRVADCATGRPR